MEGVCGGRERGHGRLDGVGGGEKDRDGAGVGICARRGWDIEVEIGLR